jgi:hypothetical protein
MYSLARSLRSLEPTDPPASPERERWRAGTTEIVIMLPWFCERLAFEKSYSFLARYFLTKPKQIKVLPKATPIFEIER